MKNILITIALTAVLSLTVYGNDEWKKGYDETDYQSTGVYICSKQSDGYYVTDENGNIIFKSDDYISATDDADRYICGGRITDGLGNPLSDKAFYNVHKLKNKNAYVAKNQAEYFGIIDDTGSEIVPFEYDFIGSEFIGSFLDVYDYSDGVFSGMGLFDDNFELVLPTEYVNICIADDNSFYAAIKNTDEFDWYKYENGNIAFVKSSDWCLGYDIFKADDVMPIIRQNGDKPPLYGIIDKDFNVLCEPKYDTLSYENGYALVQYASKSYYDVKGLGTVFDGKFGVIDKYGKEVIPCEYDKITRITDDIFICAEDGKKDIISFGEEPQRPECSPWAENDIICGRLYGIIPDEVNGDFLQKITRGEFCRLAVQTYLKCVLWDDIDNYIAVFAENTENPFNDTDDKYIVLANYLGIVSGKGNGRFMPDDYITRQEAAVMLVNMAQALNYNLTEEKVSFTDEEYFADWARESIYKIVGFKADGGSAVMGGTGNGKFSPWLNYDRQQAVSTMVRIYDIALDILSRKYR